MISFIQPQMSLPVNKQVYLANLLSANAVVTDLAVKDIPYPTLADGEVLVKATSLSVEPHMRVLLAQITETGAPITNFLIGTVVESKAEAFVVGDTVTGILPLQLYVAAPASALTTLDVAATKAAGLPLTLFLGALGMPGQTAYGAVTEGGFKAGDVVFVSGAAGAVGSLMGQLARHLGAKKVIGSAGGPTKCKIVVEKYGFDACIDYKAHETHAEIVAALASALGGDKIDFFADLTGGPVTDAAIDLLGTLSRVVVVGATAEYGNVKPRQTESLFPKLIARAITIRGFFVWIWRTVPGNVEKHISAVLPLLADGTIKADESTVTGIDSTPAAFAGLFTGANTGKMVINI
jgi:NADPH-dependent curcumin reductase CurA